MSMGHGKSTNSASDIGNDYDINKKITVDMKFSPSTARFTANVSLINIYCTNLTDTNHPSSIFVSISMDENGNKYVLTETETELQRGMEDDTKATGQIKMNAIVTLNGTHNMYVFIRTDNGTLDVSEIVITYSDQRD